MNWNAVIKSLQNEAGYLANKIQTNTNPYFNQKQELLKMELCTILAKALAEGMKEISKSSYVQDAWPEK